MSDVLEKTKLTFEKLGVSSEEAVDELFRELTSQADSEAKSIANEEAVEGFRIRWLGRKNSISVRLRENWLKPAPSDLKRSRDSGSAGWDAKTAFPCDYAKIG